MGQLRTANKRRNRAILAAQARKNAAKAEPAVRTESGVEAS